MYNEESDHELTCTSIDELKLVSTRDNLHFIDAFRIKNMNIQSDVVPHIVKAIECIPYLYLLEISSHEYHKDNFGYLSDDDVDKIIHACETLPRFGSMVFYALAFQSRKIIQYAEKHNMHFCSNFTDFRGQRSENFFPYMISIPDKSETRMYKFTHDPNNEQSFNHFLDYIRVNGEKIYSIHFNHPNYQTRYTLSNEKIDQFIEVIKYIPSIRVVSFCVYNVDPDHFEQCINTTYVTRVWFVSNNFGKDDVYLMPLSKRDIMIKSRTKSATKR